MARGARAKVHRFLKAAAAKAKAKAKAAPLPAAIAATAAPTPWVWAAPMPIAAAPTPPPLQPPAAGMLNGWSDSAVSGVDISAGARAEAFESRPSGPLLSQGPELRRLPPAVDSESDSEMIYVIDSDSSSVYTECESGTDGGSMPPFQLAP